MAKLFESSAINGMRLANRFVRSATWEGMASETGESTSRLVDLMADLARGGVGLIISSHAYVLPEGQAGPWQLGIYSDELIPGLKKMTAAVHANGGKIVLQLAHAGLFAGTELTGQAAVAPSAVQGFTKQPPRAMTAADIQRVVEAFAAGADRARRAEFDGVQIHAAHGYLLSQFLSPLFNHRNDAYGGAIHKRARAVVEVLLAIRKAVGQDYPVLVKMNCQDFVAGGLVLEDSVKAAATLAASGIDAIEISGGTAISGKLNPARAGINSAEKESYFQNEARAFREKIDVPLILVGGNRSYERVARLVNEGLADYISMSRPFIREPDLINRWRAGDRRPAACRSDNLCFGPARKGDGIYCVTAEKEKGNLP